MFLAGVALLASGVAVVIVAAARRSSARDDPEVERLRSSAARWIALGSGIALLGPVVWGVAILQFLRRMVMPQSYLPAVAERGDQIVDAIAAYEAKHGSAPEAIERLVPEFLPRLPPTGFEDARWEYRTSVSGKWQLCAAIYTPFTDFDEFRYVPSHEPPRAGYRNWVIHGDWMYLDE